MIDTKYLLAVSGATFRQIDHWARSGYLEPREGFSPGSGTWRTYDDCEADVAMLLVALGDLDMLGASGRGRRSDYLGALIDHVRANGLMGDWDVGFVTLHLDDVRSKVTV